MNLLNTFDHLSATKVGFGVRALMISDLGVDSPMWHKLAKLGCTLEVAEDVYSALDRIVDGPEQFELIVIDCDTSGGLALGLRTHAILKSTGRCIPLILVSAETADQSFPNSRYEPTLLRAPSSSISLRVGFEHALQERLLYSRAS